MSAIGKCAELDGREAAWYSCAVWSRFHHGAVSDEEVANGRLLAAVGYLPGLCFVGLFGAPENRYVGFHARQGLLVFLLEFAVWVALAIYDASLGKIPVLGFLIGAAARFVVGLGFLGMTMYGVVKAATGEMARIPIVGDAIEKVPF